MARIRNASAAELRDMVLNAFPDLSARAQPGQVAGMLDYLQQGAFGPDQAAFEGVFGRVDDFFDQYRSFETKYRSAIQKHLNRSKFNRVSVQQKLQRNIIDLNAVDFGVRRELEDDLKGKVLKLNSFIHDQGFFGINLPSSNAYRAQFRANIDLSQGIVHPGQLMMLNTVFNFNPEKAGLDSLYVGSIFETTKSLEETWKKMKDLAEDPNLTGAQRLSRQIDPFYTVKKGERVLTLDIESTGIHEKAVVRQFAVAEMVKGETGFSKPELLSEFNKQFASSQFNGISVTTMNNSTRSLNEFISNISGGVQQDFGPGGNTFLEEFNKLTARLLDADRVAGHNIHFDLDMLVRTAQQQDGYASYATQVTGRGKVTAAELVNELNEKISGGNYIIDTLQSTRLYMYSQAQMAMRNQGIAGSEEFIKKLLSEEAATDVRLGGAVKYAGVTEFIANTNFFELIEQSDASEAREVFDMVTKGSHMADTDVVLQSYIGRFLHEKAESGELKLKFLAERNGEISKFGQWARSKILKSSAIVGTTNVASVEHMSQQVFDYLQTESGLQGMRIRASYSEVQNLFGSSPRPSVIDLFGSERVSDLSTLMQRTGRDLPDPIADYLSGTITFNKDRSSYFYTTAEATVELNNDLAESFIRRRLDDARNNLLQSQLGSERIAQISRNANLTTAVDELFRAANAADDSILDTGISLLTQSQAENIAEMQRSISTLGNVGTTANLPVFDKYESALGTLYQDLGTGFDSDSGASLLDFFRPRADQNVFGRGVKDFTSVNAGEIAKRFAQIGDPYAGLVDPLSRALSTGLAEATVGMAQSAAKVAVTTPGASSDLIKRLKYLDYGKQFVELGIFYGKSQDKLRVFDIGLADDLVTSKITVQPEIIRHIMERTGMQGTVQEFGFSKAVMNSGEVRFNIVWDVARSSQQDAHTRLATGLFDLLSAPDAHQQVADILKVSHSQLPDDVLIQIQQAKALRTGGQGKVDESIANLATKIQDNGIVQAYIDKEPGSRVSKLFRDLNINIENDVLLQARFQSEGFNITGVTAELGERYSAFGPVMNPQAINIAESADSARALAAAPDDVGAGIKAQQVMAEEIEASGIGPRLGKLIESRRLGLKDTDKLASFYVANKAKIGWGAIGVLAAGLGYYASKKHRERSLYEETLAQQPYEIGSQTRQINDTMIGMRSSSPKYSDSLATAGVVGNLDRMKIGHTKMGNNKNDHLFGV